MPLCVEGRDVVLHDRRVAAAALGREHVVVVVPAVRLAVLLVEAVLAKCVATLGTKEVVRVPVLVQRGHAFLGKKKWILGKEKGGGRSKEKLHFFVKKDAFICKETLHFFA